VSDEGPNLVLEHLRAIRASQEATREDIREIKAILDRIDLARLDSIQKELGMMRLREEQREASHQALTLTLSRQMVETGLMVERRLVEMETRSEERFTGLDDRLGRIESRLDRIEQRLGLVEA